MNPKMNFSLAFLYSRINHIFICLCARSAKVRAFLNVRVFRSAFLALVISGKRKSVGKTAS